MIFNIAGTIDLFSDLKNLKTSKGIKIYFHSWEERTTISITAKFGGEILQSMDIMAMQSLHISYIIVLAPANQHPFQAEVGIDSISALE